MKYITPVIIILAFTSCLSLKESVGRKVINTVTRVVPTLENDTIIPVEIDSFVYAIHDTLNNLRDTVIIRDSVTNTISSVITEYTDSSCIGTVIYDFKVSRDTITLIEEVEVDRYITEKCNDNFKLNTLSWILITVTILLGLYILYHIFIT